MRNGFWTATLDAEVNNTLEVKKAFPSLSFANVIEAHVGPDGALYVVEYGGSYGSNVGNQRIARIEYLGNCSPTVSTFRPVGGQSTPARARLGVHLGEGKVFYGNRDIQGRR